MCELPGLTGVLSACGERLGRTMGSAVNSGMRAALVAPATRTYGKEAAEFEPAGLSPGELAGRLLGGVACRRMLPTGAT
ncbi:hypothetical protein AB0N07_35810 [Streptomyces sp. NPDC051172]|uniref:hypothetical protein n=1 Tax=Streptomyces sp. NPDC051172 TaxID=3155796 RepID=UPI003438C852